MRSLVTGGAGFIGSHLVDALVRADDRVLVVDDLSSGARENLAAALGSGAELAEVDIRDEDALAESFGRHRPQRVFHLAAQVDVRRAVTNPAFDASVNVLGTIRVLEAARREGAALVFASTGGGIYGEGEGRELPLDETADTRPEAPYGLSKLAAEGYVDLFRRVHRLPAVALRLGNVYGPRQDPHGEAGVVAIFCGQMVAGATPTVFGDGTQTRDYVYVADTVDALARAGEQLVGAGAEVGGPLNVGTGVETSVLELAEAIRTVADRPDLLPKLAPPRTGEVQRNALDASAAARALGWRPTTGLEAGLQQTLASVQEQLR